MLNAEKSALQQSMAETRERMHQLELEKGERRQRQGDRSSAPKVRSSHGMLNILEHCQ